MFHPQFQTQAPIRQKSVRTTKRPGVDVGDPDGLWKADFAERTLKSLEDHRSGKTQSIPYAEVRKRLGLAD